MATRLNRGLRIKRLVRRFNIITTFLLAKSIYYDFKKVDVLMGRAEADIAFKKTNEFKIAKSIAKCSSSFLDCELDLDKQIFEKKLVCNPIFSTYFHERFLKKQGQKKTLPKKQFVR